jgi:hypothetical protein
MKTKLTEKFGLHGIHRPMGADNPDRLVEFEKILGTSLPDDYRDFLLHLAPSAFDYDVKLRPLVASPWATNGLNRLQAFYGFDSNSAYDIISSYETIEGVPEGMIPISFDGGSNNILLALSEPAGRIYFQDKDTGNVYLCAHTFTDFLNRFESVDE